ncbi:hypothetical protein WSM22_42140 [Cytophagales bacterium WSM2-2]|nr:hypothetical protein WSM22_42140 [Cytophagales bacterium WSM2-2]
MEKIEFSTSSGFVYATITVNEDVKCLQDSWYGSFGVQENFKKVLLMLLTQVEAVGSSKGLSDTSQMTASFDGSRDWMVQEIIPKLISMGIRYHAIVIPKNIFTKLSLKDYVQRVAGMEIRQFGDLKEAKEWLLSCN